MRTDPLCLETCSFLQANCMVLTGTACLNILFSSHVDRPGGGHMVQSHATFNFSSKRLMLWQLESARWKSPVQIVASARTSRGSCSQPPQSLCLSRPSSPASFLWLLWTPNSLTVSSFVTFLVSLVDGRFSFVYCWLLYSCFLFYCISFWLVLPK